MYENNEYHKFSMAKVTEFLKIVDKKQNDVYIQLHKRNESEIKRNRDILKVIIKTVILCGRQGLALRGGHDSRSLDLICHYITTVISELYYVTVLIVVTICF